MIRVAVDARNLRADERGMGRYVRPVLQTFAQTTGVQLTLLVRDEREAPALQAIIGAPVSVKHERTARSPSYDAVWYPWNGMRFQTAGPSLVTINDDFAFSYPARGFVARRREQSPIVRAARNATRIATISRWSLEQISRRFGIATGRIGIIPLVPAPFFTPGHEAALYAEPFVLVVGGSEARKNIAFLIAAFAAAFPNGDVRLVIAGSVDPPTREAVRRCELPIDVIGTCDDARLRALYRTAAAVAVPSLAEGFGLVAVEAQACGTAVVAANASALPEAVGDAGLLVDVHDRAAWSAALHDVVRDETLRSRLAARGLARWAGAAQTDTASAVLALLHGSIDDLA